MKIHAVLVFVVFLCAANGFAQEKKQTAPGLSSVEGAASVTLPTKKVKKPSSLVGMRALPLDMSSIIQGEKGLQFEYDLRDGSQLTVGSQVLDKDTFTVQFGKLGGLLGKVVSSGDRDKYHLIMRWPQIINPNKIEIISEKGTPLLSVDLDPEFFTDWEEKKADWKLTKKSDAATLNLGLSEGQFNYEKLLKSKEGFRFCFIQKVEKDQSQLCSGYFGIARSKSGAVMKALNKGGQNVRVLLNGEEAKSKDLITLERGMVFRFFAEMSSGVSYEITSRPPVIEMRNVQQKGQNYEIYLQEVVPVSSAVEVAKEQYSKLTSIIGFESTIKDERKLWKFTLRSSNSTIYIMGKSGGVFRQDFTFDQMPEGDVRVYIEENTPEGTYLEVPKIYGVKSEGTTLLSTQKSIENKGSSGFIWRFYAPKNNDFNKSYLTIRKGDREFKSYYEFFRGNARELSYRLTITSGSGEAKTMQEGAFNYWFEDLFGWSHPTYARLRWGMSVKYFQQIGGQLFASGTSSSNDFKVLTADFKYRSPAGLWGRDEAVGFMLSYQDLTLGIDQAGMYGVGAFWARSMPEVFDRLFNYIPGMEYPKWVDMEYIQYVGSLNSAYTIGANSALNFHGKVFWTPVVFGEAGFGIKQYAFSNAQTNTQVSFNSFYATVGMGLNF